jgi:hypothetical protein
MSSTDFFTSDGSKVYLSTAAPVALTTSDFGALSFTEIKEVTNIGTIGATRAVVTHTTLSDGIAHKRTGSTNYGAMSLGMARVVADPGQALLKAAVGSNENYSFKIAMQDGTFLYFQGQVMAYPVTVGGVDAVVSSEVTSEIDTPIVETV